MTLYEYRGTLVRFIDADTAVIDIDLGLRVWQHDEHVRLVGINAPDKQPAKSKATAIAEHLCPAGTSVIVRTEKDRGDKYGRWLATIVVPTSEVSINDLLVQMGAAVPWDGTGTRPEAAA